MAGIPDCDPLDPAEVGADLALDVGNRRIVGMPFKVGVLYPAGDPLQALPPPASGGLFLTTPWPDLPGIESTLHLQVWIHDAAAVGGFSTPLGFRALQDEFC